MGLVSFLSTLPTLLPNTPSPSSRCPIPYGVISCKIEDGVGRREVLKCFGAAISLVFVLLFDTLFLVLSKWYTCTGTVLMARVLLSGWAYLVADLENLYWATFKKKGNEMEKTSNFFQILHYRQNVKGNNGGYPLSRGRSAPGLI
ncbi:hypothetical protein Hdeb2414_s0002g00055881 [Helianthus debilis subsp. tardiflorus]